MKKKVFIVLGLFIPLFALADENVLWYDKPAVEWVEALPLGNSRLGAMVYGGLDLTDEVMASINGGKK